MGVMLVIGLALVILLVSVILCKKCCKKGSKLHVLLVK